MHPAPGYDGPGTVSFALPEHPLPPPPRPGCQYEIPSDDTDPEDEDSPLTMAYNPVIVAIRRNSRRENRYRRATYYDSNPAQFTYAYPGGRGSARW